MLTLSEGGRQVCFLGGFGLKHKSAVYVGGSFGLWGSVWGFPQADGDLPGCGRQGVGPGPGCVVVPMYSDGCSAVYVCVCVSLPALV